MTSDRANLPCTCRTMTMGGRQVVIPCENPGPGLCARCLIECATTTEAVA